MVEIKDEMIKKKIRQTWRLQYLKDVVLARILGRGKSEIDEIVDHRNRRRLLGLKSRVQGR